MYRIVTDPAVVDQIAGLPFEALDAYAQVLAVLELVPWSGHPINKRNPEGNVRVLPCFGRIGSWSCKTPPI